MPHSLSTAFRALFFDHPHAHGMTYTQHLCGALGYARESLIATAALVVHAAVPGVLETSGSDRIRALAESFPPRPPKQAQDTRRPNTLSE